MLKVNAFNIQKTLIFHIGVEGENNMKKLAIAGASVALAALPVVGVFAATSGQFTDTLRVTIESGCTLENSTQASAGDYSVSDREFSATIGAGTVGYLNADNTGAATTTEGTVSIACNTNAQADTYTVAVAIDGLTYSGTTIAGGNYDNGDTSGWAIKSNASGATSNPFASYTAASSTTFLTGNASTAVTFNPSYKVYVAPNQAPGTYVGHAVYTITMD